MISPWITVALAGLWVLTVVYVVGLGRRLRDARAFEEAARRSPIAFAVFDARDRLQFFTRRFAAVQARRGAPPRLGDDFRGLIQAQLDSGAVLDAAGREAGWLEQRMAEHRLRRRRAEVATRDGHWLEVEEAHPNGGSLVALIDIEDIVARSVALESAREAAEASNRAKGEFLANMSHEIRTPLNGMIGVAEMLSRTGLDPRQKEMLEIIKSSGATLDRLLSDILDLARMESRRLEIRREAFHLGEALRGVCRLVELRATEKRLSFLVDIAPEAEREVEGDADRLKQVILNLLSNAVKFTSEGGVGLTVRRLDADAGGAPMYLFEVRDTGIGFSSVDRERLFGRFEQADGSITRQYGGSGLGLSIASQLSSLMGGSVEVESAPGAGSAFRVRLPLPDAARRSVAAAASAEPKPAEASPSLKVLLAEDHPVNRRVIELMFGMAGWSMVLAADGQEATERFETERFDLVLMDLQMPVMDGLTAIRRIRATEQAKGLPPTPVVALSANAMPDHVGQALAAGADAHVAKPVTPRSLFSAIDEVMGRARPEAAPARSA